MDERYPLTYSVDYPDRPLNRLSSAFRIFTVIPIAIVLLALASSPWTIEPGSDIPWSAFGGGAGLLFLPLLLMILFRKKYPRWWFDFNRELLRFTQRVYVYLALMSDVYPSTDEQQYVHLDIEYPNAETDLARGMPLVKWFLAIPHYIVLLFLYIAALFAVIFAWFAILFTGRYPRSIFDFLVGVQRWSLRVDAYAFILVTDKYPPFSLEETQGTPPAAGESPVT